MAIPSWILVAILQSLGPKILDKLLDLIIEWAKEINGKDAEAPDSTDEEIEDELLFNDNVDFKV